MHEIVRLWLAARSRKRSRSIVESSQQLERVPELTEAASHLAWEHRLSVDDALYLTVAIGCGARLLTADDDLAHAARLEGCA